MPTIWNAMRVAALLLVAAAQSGLDIRPTRADDAVTVQLSIKNHRFVPAEVGAPAGKPILLKIRNLDATPAEFESITLRVEKVIAGHGEAIVRLRPLEPGRYSFFDDFNRSTTHGTLVVQQR
jgi:hypothetical protein